MRRIVALLFLLCCLAVVSPAVGPGSHSSHSRAARSSKSKPVHVRGYTHKDGTYVAPYYRSAPGTAEHHSADVTHTTAHSATGGTIERDSRGRIKRSASVRRDFMRSHPCPSTGKTSGRCPGYIIDHVQALECGGPDSATNMQWQTTADAKAKDKLERQCRL